MRRITAGVDGKKGSAALGTQSGTRAMSFVKLELIWSDLCSDRFVDRSVREVYATLLDDGDYLGSISTMNRLLKRDSASRERRRQRRHPAYKKP